MFLVKYIIYIKIHSCAMTSSEAMEIEDVIGRGHGAQQLGEGTLGKDDDAEEEAEDDEEDVSGLIHLLDEASAMPVGGDQIPLFLQVIETTHLVGSKATQLKERAVYDLTRAYCVTHQYEQVVQFFTGGVGQSFLNTITKAKTAKVVRQVLDIVCTTAPEALDMQESVARSILQWTEQEKRSFLRQRVQAKLAAILLEQHKYVASLELCDKLLLELKKLDDKQLLVETHLLESKIHFALRNVPKAKAALTASRTAANAIYVAPNLQADIDTMSGTIHTEEGDYNTAHSYFLEAFEQLDQMNSSTQAISALKYMMLCRILDSLRAALQLSSKGSVAIKTPTLDLGSLLTSKQSIKYAGRNIQAMSKIADAASHRNLKEFQAILHEFAVELQEDLLIKHHLHVLQEQLLESNLIRIIEPYSCVELEHIAKSIDLPVVVVEKKLSQMILDGKFLGILDQGRGQLVVYEESQKDSVLETGLQVLHHMDAVVTSLFERSKALHTMQL